MPKTENVTGTLIAKHHDALMGAWLAAQKRDGRSRDVGTDAASADLARQFLDQLHRGFSSGRLDDITGAEWAPMRELLEDFSRARATQGIQPDRDGGLRLLPQGAAVRYPATRTGCRMRADCPRETWTVTRLLDALGLYTIECYSRTREEVIGRQQQELLELSTPVVELWDGILALPLIGTLDSARTQIVMENLLERIVNPARKSPSSTSPACRPSIPWWRST